MRDKPHSKRYTWLQASTPSGLHACLLAFLLAQAGCIPHYSDFVGAQNDTMADGTSEETDSSHGTGDIRISDWCTPDCTGKQCGSDGCGGSCGTCTGEDSCHDGICKPGPCTQDCTGKECGSDGCEGTCGSCQPNEYCDGGLCKPQCGDGDCVGGETCATCPGDCGSCCPNGACDNGETKETCPEDCGGVCEPGVSSGKKTNGQHGVVWVEIPAGCFVMGCSPGDGDCAGAENPPHEVTVAKFEMMETEVTEGQWAAVMPGVKVDGVQVELAPSCDYNAGGGASSPVECVNWKEAKAFCEAVDAKGRLCTEAEWEYAARAGTTTKYYCGDSASCLNGIAWYSGNSDDGPGKHKHDVKGKAPNAYGLYDMLGNVWEWVEDCWHNDYDLNDDGEGDWSVGYPAWTAPPCDSGSGRVFRGGGFGNDDDHLRVSNRGDDDPSDDDDGLGLRCCRSE